MVLSDRLQMFHSQFLTSVEAKVRLLRAVGETGDSGSSMPGTTIQSLKRPTTIVDGSPSGKSQLGSRPICSALRNAGYDGYHLMWRGIGDGQGGIRKVAP